MNDNHVVSLELSKKLKEVGYPQDGEFNWVKYYSKWQISYHFKEDPERDWEWWVAPLASELMERLRSYSIIAYWANLSNQYGVARTIGEDGNVRWRDIQFADTMPDVLAKMYIYLAGEGLLE